MIYVIIQHTNTKVLKTVLGITSVYIKLTYTLGLSLNSSLDWELMHLSIKKSFIQVKVLYKTTTTHSILVKCIPVYQKK